MRDLIRSKSIWWVGGAMLIGVGLAAARALRVDIDIDPWREDALGY